MRYLEWYNCSGLHDLTLFAIDSENDTREIKYDTNTSSKQQTMMSFSNAKTWQEHSSLASI